MTAEDGFLSLSEIDHFLGTKYDSFSRPEPVARHNSLPIVHDSRMHGRHVNGPASHRGELVRHGSLDMSPPNMVVSGVGRGDQVYGYANYHDGYSGRHVGIVHGSSQPNSDQMLRRAGHAHEGYAPSHSGNQPSGSFGNSQVSNPAHSNACANMQSRMLRLTVNQGDLNVLSAPVDRPSVDQRSEYYGRNVANESYQDRFIQMPRSIPHNTHADSGVRAYAHRTSSLPSDQLMHSAPGGTYPHAKVNHSEQYRTLHSSGSLDLSRLGHQAGCAADQQYRNLHGSGSGEHFRKPHSSGSAEHFRAVPSSASPDARVLHGGAHENYRQVSPRQSLGSGEYFPQEHMKVSPMHSMGSGDQFSASDHRLVSPRQSLGSGDHYAGLDQISNARMISPRQSGDHFLSVDQVPSGQPSVRLVVNDEDPRSSQLLSPGGSCVSDLSSDGSYFSTWSDVPDDETPRGRAGYDQGADFPDVAMIPSPEASSNLAPGDARKGKPSRLERAQLARRRRRAYLATKRSSAASPGKDGTPGSKGADRESASTEASPDASAKSGMLPSPSSLSPDVIELTRSVGRPDSNGSPVLGAGSSAGSGRPPLARQDSLPGPVLPRSESLSGAASPVGLSPIDRSRSPKRKAIPELILPHEMDAASPSLPVHSPALSAVGDVVDDAKQRIIDELQAKIDTLTVENKNLKENLERAFMLLRSVAPGTATAKTSDAPSPATPQ